MESLALNNQPLVTDFAKKGCNCLGFAPAVNFTYNSSTKVVVATDAGTYPSGDALKRINVLVHDEYGGTKAGTITAAAGNTGSIDVSGLNPAKGLNLTATVVTTSGCDSDGSARKIAASGSLSNWSQNWIAE